MRTLLALVGVAGLASGFAPLQPTKLKVNIRSTATLEAPPEVSTPGTLSRDRYIATNRFIIRSGKDAAFEKRWTDRKSRLASLPGFKYFQLMRRVKLDDSSPDFEDDYNYVSFTIWETKKDFNAWRQGDAFKEAHGGSSISAFIGTLVSSLFLMKGAPKPAFYDGLLLQSTVPATVPATVDGWRTLTSDGVSLLPEEAFVACNQFFVPTENEVAFEQRWASRESTLKECDGFVAFSMLRRDGKAKGHGVSPLEPGEPTYQSTTVWRDRAAFEAWRAGPAKQAHAGPANAAPAAPLWTRPPLPVFYEAKLVIASPTGA
jgi:heme-degrading monooxygenase HmoA